MSFRSSSVVVSVVVALGCARTDSAIVPSEPASTRFMIVFRELREPGRANDLPPPLMQAAVFAGRVVSRDRARAAEANHCYSLTANPCLFPVPKNRPVTLVALDSPGLVEQPPLPVDTSEARDEPQDAIEFVEFGFPDFTPMPCRDFVSPARGVCVIHALSDTVVVLTYRPMRRIVVTMTGAGELSLTVAAPKHLGLDPAPIANPLNRTYRHSLVIAPSPEPVFALWLPFGGRVSVEALPDGGGQVRFKRWQGCSAAGATCELRTEERVSVRADFEYWDCTAIGRGYVARPVDQRCILREPGPPGSRTPEPAAGPAP